MDDRLISEIVQVRVLVLDKQQAAELDAFLDGGGLSGYEAGIATTDYHGAATEFFRLLPLAGQDAELDALLDSVRGKAENLLDKHYTELRQLSCFGVARLRTGRIPRSAAFAAAMAALQAQIDSGQPSAAEPSEPAATSSDVKPPR